MGSRSWTRIRKGMPSPERDERERKISRLVFVLPKLVTAAAAVPPATAATTGAVAAAATGATPPALGPGFRLIDGESPAVRLVTVQGGDSRLGLLQHRVGHRLLDDLQEIGPLFLGKQIRDLLIRGGALVVVKDRDLFHAGVEDAPAGAHAGRGFFGAHFFYLRRCGSFCLAPFR